MTKQQFDDLYLGKKVHCDTEEKANAFLKLAHGFGYKWSTGLSLLDCNYYYQYREDTCYNVNDYGFLYAGVDLYKKSGYTIVKFELEKENNMKFKVGQQVRVRSDLVVDKKYGDDKFIIDMQYLRGKQVTIKTIHKEKYIIEEDDGWFWTNEMLEPIEEFKVGDVVYDKSGQRLEVIGFGVKVRTKNGVEFYRPYEELTHKKPLQKITRKELADKGFELVE